MYYYPDYCWCYYYFSQQLLCVLNAFQKTVCSFCWCCLHGGVCLGITGWENASFPRFSLLFSLPPEGLKKVRNPDRMYRSAVCYAGHGPPKNISDDTETNSKSQLLILHCCCKRPLAGQSIIHPSIHLFTSWFHPSPCPLPLLFFSNTTPPPAVLLIEVSALQDHAVNSWSVVVN